MKLTKTPPQKRTIELFPNKNKMLAYFPELIFIQSANKLYVFYEYENTLNTITHIVSGYHGEICFRNIKPSIDNFWNTEFIYNGCIETLKKKDWWKHIEYKSNLTDTAIAAIRNQDIDFFNFIIKQQNIDGYDRIISTFIKKGDLTKKDFLIEKEIEFYETMATLLSLGITDDLFYFYKNKTKDFHINKLLDEYLPIGTKEIRFITKLDEINFAYYTTQCIKKCYHNQAIAIINLNEKNSINDLNEDLLLAAHYHKTTLLVDFLIEKGANNLNEAMLVATKAGRKSIIERLLKYGANNIDECLKISPLEHISEVLKKRKIMNITKFPEQKRTILIGYSKPKLIYLPPLVFIEHRKNLFVTYEYEEKLYLLNKVISNIEDDGIRICFGEHMEPSIDNFWNSIFNGFNSRITSKPNWWKSKNRKRQKAYKELILEIDDLKFVKSIIHLVPQETIDELVNTTHNLDVFKLALEYNPKISVSDVLRKNKEIIQTFIDYVENNFTKERMESTFADMAQFSISSRNNNEIFCRFEKYLNKEMYKHSLLTAICEENNLLIKYIFKHIQDNKIKLNKQIVDQCVTILIVRNNFTCLKELFKLKPSKEILEEEINRFHPQSMRELIQKALDSK